MRKFIKRATNQTLGWLIAVVVLAWRLTCRRKVYNDPRPKLRSDKTPYVYALLHAHQAAAVMLNDEPQLAAMVSRSADGDLLVPSLRALGVKPVRGSSRKGGQDKGGAHALAQITELNAGGIPALLAVDGPRGPRGHVHRGIIALAQANGAVILPVIAWADQAWTVRRAWDQMKIPCPCTHLRLIFLKPLAPTPQTDEHTWRTHLGLVLAAGEQRAQAGHFNLEPTAAEVKY